MSELYETGPTPDVEEVLQREPAMSAVPVELAQPVDVRPVPAKRGRWDSVTLVVGAPRIVLDADPRVKRWITAVSLPSGSTATSIILGTEAQIKAPNGPFGFIYTPGLNVPPFEGISEETWAVAVGGAGQLVVFSFRAEFWAD